jgi:hypothetical protein
VNQEKKLMKKGDGDNDGVRDEIEKVVVEVDFVMILIFFESMIITELLKLL